MKTILMTILLFAVPVKAQEVRRTLPKVETKTLDGVSYKCLDVEEWRSVLLLANDYQGLFDWRLKIQGVLDAHEAMLQTYDLKIQGYEAMLKLKDADVKFLSKHIEDMEKEQKRKSLEERLEKYALWAVILVETVVIGVLGTRNWATASP